MSVADIDTLPGRAQFPKNQWYVSALASELSKTPIHRMLFGDPVVLYRTKSGAPMAMFDRCPHRGMRLSNGGTVIGDTLQCNYHGIRFGMDGRACLVPSGGEPPSGMRVHKYPTVEKFGFIWTWAGDPELADENKLPRFEEIGLGIEGFHDYYGLVLEMDANYLYSFENLVDATHITFLHHGMIDSGQVASHPYRCEVEGNRVSMIREFENDLMPPMLRRAMGLKSERADRVLNLSSYAPNVCVVGQTYQDTDANDDFVRDTRLVFGVTPATLKSSYQFVGVTQNFENHHPGLFDDLKTLLMEDVVALNDIQKMFDMLEPENRVPEVSVKSDEGAFHSRKIIRRQIAEEQTALAAE